MGQNDVKSKYAVMIHMMIIVIVFALLIFLVDTDQELRAKWYMWFQDDRQCHLSQCLTVLTERVTSVIVLLFNFSTSHTKTKQTKKIFFGHNFVCPVSTLAS